MSEETKTIWGRLIEARKSIKNPPLDCINPHFKNRYASLAATLEEVNKVCRWEGIAYIQSLVKCEYGYELASRVVDQDGNSVELSTFPVTASQNAQAFGSELTYKKRQQAQADWGIVGEEDDDAEAAVAPAASKANAKAPDRLSAVRAAYSDALAHGIKREGIEAWLVANAGCELASIASMDDGQLAAFCKYLNDRVADIEALSKGQAA